MIVDRNYSNSQNSQKDQNIRGDLRTRSAQTKSSGSPHQKLNHKHYQHCCGSNLQKGERGLDPDWIEANCRSVDTKEATEFLYYTAKSPGIIIEGSNGQYQFRPDKPWSDKQGKKSPKYRTAAGDDYDALLPKHPNNDLYWRDIEALKTACWQINGHPYLLVTEGGFKAISTCSQNLPTIGLLGVEMGLTSSKADVQGKRYLVSALERYAQAGFGFILAFDADSYTKDAVKYALIKLGCQLLKFNVPVFCLPQWDESEGKGIDDYIQMNGIEAFRKKLLAQVMGFDEWCSKYGSDIVNNKLPIIPKADIIGNELAFEYRARWIYCIELKSWLIYEIDAPGVWSLVPEDCIAAEVHSILKARKIAGYGTNAYISNIIGALKRELCTRFWQEVRSTEFLPFSNGVLELDTGKFHPHSPEYRFTWRLPRDYSVVDASWIKIDNWLNQATLGRGEHKEILLCFAAAVLRGRADLQKFLHLIGSGGSGKSTFTNLLTALVGFENTVTCNLEDLEDKHEIARVFGKRLVVLPDQDKAGKRMSNFKRLTGQDRLSGRRLFENGFEFAFSGLTVVTSNFPIFHSNLGSWLIRRLLMIPFEYQCPPDRSRNLMKEFEPELSAFTSYLLSIPTSHLERVLSGIGKRSLNSTVWESLTRADGLAAWVNDWVIEKPGENTAIGSNSREWSSEGDYSPERSTLYGSYCLYCRQTNRSPKTPQNFSAELLELGQQTLGWNLKKTRVKIAGKTVRVIAGLSLRRSENNHGEPYYPTVEERLKETTEDREESGRGFELEKFRSDNSFDERGDNSSDNSKPLPNKEGDKGDNLFLSNEEGENNLKHHLSNLEIETKDLHINSNSSNEVETKELNIDSNEDVTSGHSLARQDVEVVTPAVNPTVKKVVTPTEIDWSTYPDPQPNGRGYSKEKAHRKRADKIKREILNCGNPELLLGKYNHSEIEWVCSNLLTPAQKRRIDEPVEIVQQSLFDNDNSEREEIVAMAMRFGENSSPSEVVCDVVFSKGDFVVPIGYPDYRGVIIDLINGGRTATVRSIDGYDYNWSIESLTKDS